MIIIPALLLVIRRARNTWRWNHEARRRYALRKSQGYELYHRVKMLRQEWIWSPFRPVCLPERNTMICELTAAEVVGPERMN